MAHIRQIGFELAAVAAVFTTLVGPVLAQNHAPNPYRTVEGVWGQLGQGRTWGSTSAVYIAPDGMNVWVGERCGGNQGACMQQGDWDPIMLFSPNGELVRSFGAGMIVWPHGLHVDPDGNVWVADAAGAGDKGHQVHKFSATGELLMSLGTAGVAGAGQDTFNQPSDMLVAPDGSIAGLFLVYPHYGALIDEGRAVPARALDFENHWGIIDASEMPNTAIMKTVGVRRDLRRMGIMDALTVEVFDRGAERYERWFGALIRDDNPSRRFADGAHPNQRTYALYSLDALDAL